LRRTLRLFPIGSNKNKLPQPNIKTIVQSVAGREELVGGTHPFLFFKSATIWQVVKLLAVVQSLLQTNNGGKYE
jgi:hypothetical protein